jgi:hypothetical protein
LTLAGTLGVKSESTTGTGVPGWLVPLASLALIAFASAGAFLLRVRRRSA